MLASVCLRLPSPFFKEHGYHGTPVRALASTAKIEAGSLCGLLSSMRKIPFGNLVGALDALIDGLRRASVADLLV